MDIGVSVVLWFSIFMCKCEVVVLLGLMKF